MVKSANISRKTFETDISVYLELGSVEESSIDSGVPFFDHMISALAKHGRMKIDLSCAGDTIIDDHHSVEDCGIVLGQAFKKALGDKKGIKRFGFASVPLDESLCQTTVDISGRPFFKYSGTPLAGYIKDYAEELTHEFFYSFAMNAGITLHIQSIYGENRHHIHESMFKSFAQSLYSAYTQDELLKGMVPSTKGAL
jgi:imidazoleglycerol-phosphate dehydratase